MLAGFLTTKPRFRFYFLHDVCKDYKSILLGIVQLTGVRFIIPVLHGIGQQLQCFVYRPTNYIILQKRISILTASLRDSSHHPIYCSVAHTFDPASPRPHLRQEAWRRLRPECKM